MKKSFIALLSVSVVLLFAVSSFALHAVPEMFEYTPSIVKSKKAQLEIGGHIRVRGETNDNYVHFNDDVSSDNTRSFNDQRVNLHVKATVSPNTMGLIELQMNEGRSSDSYGWGNCDGAKGIYRKANCKPTGVTVRQAYISHQTKALGVLAGFKVGHQLYALGNGLFFNHTQYGDDGITLWISPADGMEISLNALKFDENDSASSDDVDAYAGTFSGAFGPANVSADVTFFNDNEFGTKGADLWNFGVRGDMNVGPVAVKADVEFQTGSADEFAANGDDFDLGGYAFLLGADFDAGPVKIGVEGAYGSGDDIDTEDEYEGFITTLSDGQDYTYLYDQKAKTSAQALVATATMSSLYGNTSRTGLANTWYIGVGASGKPTPDLKLSGDVYYLQASEKVSDVDNYDEKDIGVEIDGKIEYQLDTNLVYYVEAGYLMAGDFYKNVTGPASPNPADPEDPDDAYSVRHGIILKF